MSSKKSVGTQTAPETAEKATQTEPQLMPDRPRDLTKEEIRCVIVTLTAAGHDLESIRELLYPFNLPVKVIRDTMRRFMRTASKRGRPNNNH